MRVQATPQFAIELVSGPTTTGDDEVFARRALARLKGRLGSERLIELLAPEIAAGNAVLSDLAIRSEGRFKPATTELSVQGISAAQFMDWFHNNAGNSSVMAAAQPEHFVLTVNAEGQHLVTENLGPHVRSSAVTFTTEDQAYGELLPDYSTRLVGKIALEDGTVTMHALHQFRDTDNGFEAVLTIFFPEASPDDLLEQHRRHLAVEFTN